MTTKYLPRHLNARTDHLDAVRVGAAAARGRAVVATGTAAALPLSAAAVMTAPAVAVEPSHGDAGEAAEAKAPLAFNSRGADVVALQDRLGLPADGMYGPLTTAAVKGFQKAQGLAVDGIVGPDTWSALA